mmetsp:Transcript_6522/g.22449  ORF Transcript_6522/g.22449 Transcript_6522/m.22449 type:complete len:371 (-) Transcript_6522:170-1282(-)
MHEVVHAQLLQLQHHGAKVGPQDLWVGLLLQVPFEGALRVQPEALARPRPSRPTTPLVGARSGDWGDQKGLHPNTGVVHLLLGEPRVHDIHDAVDRQRGLRDICGHDDLPAGLSPRSPGLRGLGEDPLLLRGGKAGVEGNDHGLPRRLAHLPGLALDPPARLLDLLLSRQEEQHVALLLVLVNLQHRPDGGLEVVPLRLLGVEDLHREEPSRNLNEWGVHKVGLELLGLQGGGHDHELERPNPRPLPRPPPPLALDPLQHAQQDVKVERPLVRLVQDHDRVPGQGTVRQGLAQQNSLRGVLDLRLLGGLILKPHRVSDLLPHLRSPFEGDPLGNRYGRHPPWLRDADPSPWKHGKLFRVCENLRKLGRLS